jgi:hypothetical protein
MIIVFPDTITQNTKLTSQAMFVITNLLGLLVTTTSIAFTVPAAPVTSAVSKFKTMAQVMEDYRKIANSTDTKPARKVVTKVLKNPTALDTKPINKATANLFKNASRAYLPTVPVAARNWEDAMNPVDRELNFVGVEEFNAAIEWFEYFPYAEIARRVKIAVPEMELFVKDGDVCKLVPRVGQYLDP